MVSVPSPAAMTDDQTRSNLNGHEGKAKAINFQRSMGPDREGIRLQARRGNQIEVLRVRTSFVMFEPFERAALPLAEAKKRVQSIKWFCGKVFQRSVRGPSNDATTFADELINRHFNGRSHTSRAAFVARGGVQFRARRNGKLAEPPRGRGLGSVDPWPDNHSGRGGSPTAASKGRGKSKSDFAVGICVACSEIAGLRSKRGSPPYDADGLATAINRARRGLGSKSERHRRKNDPPKLVPGWH